MIFASHVWHGKKVSYCDFLSSVVLMEDIVYILLGLVFIAVAYFLWKKYQANKLAKEQFLAQELKEREALESHPQQSEIIDLNLQQDLCSLEDNLSNSHNNDKKETCLYSAEDMDESIKTGHYLVRMLYDFSGNKDMWQLSYKANDLVWVIDSDANEDWCTGRHKETGQEGYIQKQFYVAIPRQIRSSNI